VFSFRLRSPYFWFCALIFFFELFRLLLLGCTRIKECSFCINWVSISSCNISWSLYHGWWLLLDRFWNWRRQIDRLVYDLDSREVALLFNYRNIVWLISFVVALGLYPPNLLFQRSNLRQVFNILSIELLLQTIYYFLSLGKFFVYLTLIFLHIFCLGIFFLQLLIVFILDLFDSVIVILGKFAYLLWMVLLELRG